MLGRQMGLCNRLFAAIAPPLGAIVERLVRSQVSA